ncbi:MAG: DUF4270 family protein [Bacteroidales bacterium]|nr:DUF4270 family protein [Bacteroidales bacterium]
MFIVSCKKTDNVFTLGNELIESESNIKVIDTFNVQLSTVLLDSIPTSGTGIALCGNYSDEEFGTITCKSFFQIGLPDDYDIYEGDIYDAAALILYYNGYSYGDTSISQTIYIHRIIGGMETNNGYLYNKSNVFYNPQSIGMLQLKPRPSSDDSLVLPINENIGMGLFNMLAEGSDIISNEEDFIDYFKGFAMVPDNDTNGAIIGFIANSDSLKLRLYSHRIGESIEEIYNDFPLTNPDIQFNQVISDLSNTPLKILINQKTAVLSKETEGKSYMQSCTGLMAKINFPSLSELSLIENGIILKAELILKPQESSYNTFSLPENLILYETDTLNRVGDLLYDSEGNINYAIFVFDELYHEETSYTFNITEFLENEFSDHYFDVGHGLLVSLNYTQYSTTLERVIFEANKLTPALKIYYMYY